MKIQKIFEQAADSNDILPSAAISRLPLEAKSIACWDNSCDLALFLRDLYGAEVTEDFLGHCLDQGIYKFQSYAQIFQEAALEAKPAPAAKNKLIEIPDFIDHTDFGGVAKHMIAWDNVLNNILSESGHISIAHLLEMETDLSSSIHLAAHLYYRQAFQVLRSCIESFVLPLFFSYAPAKFKEWRENNLDLPSLRGKSGLLVKMVNKNILPEKLADAIAAVYGRLNDYIHGAEESFNNKGIYSGNWQGFVYQQDKLKEWADTFSEVVILGIKVLKISLDKWYENRSELDGVCSICYAEDLDEEQEIVSETVLRKITCKECATISYRLPTGAPVVITTVEISD